MVYAADSTATIFETFDTVGAGPQSRLAQSFHHARKLIQLETYPIGIMTFGLGLVGTRNIESHVSEFERTIPGYHPEADYSVEDLAGRLHAHMRVRYEAVHPPPAVEEGLPPPTDERPVLGIVIGGFSSGQFYPDEWLMTFPDSGLRRVRSDPAGDFGLRWWGVIEPVTRLLVGIDPGVERWFVKEGVDPANARGITDDISKVFTWPIVFDGMPVQDAIDLSAFLANVTIGHSRFVVGPPVCGGHVDVATITHKGFTWVRQKKSAVKGDSVFF